jgi:hypothetical protein
MRLNHEDQPLFWGWPEESKHYNPFSIISGIHQDHAINAATNTQAGAAGEAVDATKQAVETVNPQILAAADKAATGVSTAATQANALLNPYTQAGADATTQLQALTSAKAPTLADLQIDPGYQFRIDQGLQALERAKSVGGGAGLQSGGFVRDAIKFNQDMGSQEYQNAFNRFMQLRDSNISALTGQASRGISAATGQGSNLTRAAQYGGDVGIDATNLTSQNTLQGTDRANQYNLERANAFANGIVGSTTARDNGINSFINGVVSAFVPGGPLASVGRRVTNYFGRWGGGATPGFDNPGYGDAPGGTA